MSPNNCLLLVLNVIQSKRNSCAPVLRDFLNFREKIANHDCWGWTWL